MALKQFLRLPYPFSWSARLFCWQVRPMRWQQVSADFQKMNDNLQLNCDKSGWRLLLLFDPRKHIYVRCVEYRPTTVSRED